MMVKTNYKGILNILGFLYVDRICTEDHFVENRIKTLCPTPKVHVLLVLVLALA